MKRSSCLSAMLVGLSVTVTMSSVAVAAPAAPEAAAPAAKPVLVAQATGNRGPKPKTVQQTDDPPAEGGTAPAPAAPAAPAAAPAVEPAATQGTEPTSTPAISIGGSTGAPAADTPAAAEGDPTKKPKPRPFAGTQVFVQTAMSTATVFKGQQQDYNPTVDAAAYLLPRYTLSDTFQLRGRLLFYYEFTNSDTTATRNEPRFSDTTLQLYYKKIPAVAGFKPLLAANLGVPTSSESRARTMVVAPGATLQISRGVEHVLGGELLFLFASAYSHPIYRSNTPEIRGSAPYSFSCAGGNNCSDQLSGVFNTSDSLSYTALVAGEWGKWSPALFYLGSSSWAYQGKAPTNPIDGTPVESPAGARPTNVRQASYFSAWLDYNANSWFTAEVGYSLFRTALDEDGTRGNPFFGRYQDMRVYIGANFNIDNIMKELEGGQTDAGIVRARNSKQPFWNF
jgi:hypothetical protein